MRYTRAFTSLSVFVVVVVVVVVDDVVDDVVVDDVAVGGAGVFSVVVDVGFCCC